MDKAHHIKHWDDDYENAETRKYANLNWYPKKTKLIGEGIGFTLAQPNATHLLGMWYLIEALAATAPKGQRGWLVRNGTPLTPERMFSLTRIAAIHFEEALNFFSRAEVGWLELVEMPGGSPGKKATSPAAPDDTGRLPVEPPGNLPPKPATPDDTGRKSLDETKKTDGRVQRREERGTPGGSPGIPDWEEVRAWARLNDVDETYASNLFHRTTEKNGWISNRKLIDWRKQFLRYWAEDKESFLRKKTAAPKRTAGLPADWKKGDQEWWWSEPIENIEAAQHGAAISADKKTAVRLREILACRKAK